MTQVRSLVSEAARALTGDDARFEAELLLSHSLGQSRAWLYAHAEDEVSDQTALRFRGLVAARVTGQPIAYLIGEREFWSMPLHVTADVLIPRPETELLVEQALLRIPQSSVVDIADLGTGSGAIALAIAHERPQARVVATDASGAALAVATGNSERLLCDNVRFVHGDWCAALTGLRFDLIVSNPPYIALNDQHLQAGDLRFEPAAALVAGADGLDALRAIVELAPAHLNGGSWLLLEHGMDQATAVRGLLTSRGFADEFSVTDIEGRDRVTGARWKG
jgi:release factor glutamine methyltransferase